MGNEKQKLKTAEAQTDKKKPFGLWPACGGGRLFFEEGDCEIIFILTGGKKSRILGFGERIFRQLIARLSSSVGRRDETTLLLQMSTKRRKKYSGRECSR
jgi:hypothetical protein